MKRGGGDYDRLAGMLAELHLRMPPIPETLRRQLKERAEWVFSTRTFKAPPTDLLYYVRKAIAGGAARIVRSSRARPRPILSPCTSISFRRPSSSSSSSGGARRHQFLPRSTPSSRKARNSRGRCPLPSGAAASRQTDGLRWWALTSARDSGRWRRVPNTRCAPVPPNAWVRGRLRLPGPSSQKRFAGVAQERDPRHIPAN
jgi:hypothetical protein